MTMFFRSAPLILSFIVIVGFVNCSAPSFTAIDNPDDGLSSSSDSGGLVPDVSTVDANGTIQAYQDLKFSFTIPNFNPSLTYSFTNLPSWASYDPTSGTVTGIPTVATDYANVQIGAGGSTLGPYKISVIGNPMKEQQWHLTNTGQSGYAGLSGISGNDIHLTNTIANRILGSGIKVAVSDSGVVESHKGLQANLLSGMSRNYNVNYASTHSWLGNSTPSLSNAGDAHGTAVAGLIAETGWTGYGGRGVAPAAKWAGFLFIPAQDNLTSTGYYSAGLLDQFAGDFDIFNYSWGDYQCGLYEYSDTYKAKLKAGVTNLRGGKGAIYLKAAGNEYTGYLSDCYTGVSDSDQYAGNSNFSEEGTTPYVIMVGALKASGTSSSYSSPGSNIWISAPGGEFGWDSPPSSTTSYYAQPALVTTDFPGCNYGLKTESKTHSNFNACGNPNTSGEHTNTMNGTSGATPIVSGAVALILSANPNLTWRDVKHILAVTADRVDPNVAAAGNPLGYDLTGYVAEPAWTRNGAGLYFHNWYGFGRVNVDAAVTMAKTYVSGWGAQIETNSGTSWKYDSGTLNVAVANSAAGTSKTLTVTDNLFIEDMQFRVKATNCIGYVGIEVTSPAGTRSVIHNVNSRVLDTVIDSHVYLSNAFYGERSNGVWTMKMVGGGTSCTTTWNNWQLNVIGH